MAGPTESEPNLCPEPADEEPDQVPSPGGAEHQEEHSPQQPPSSSAAPGCYGCHGVKDAGGSAEKAHSSLKTGSGWDHQH